MPQKTDLQTYLLEPLAALWQSDRLLAIALLLTALCAIWAVLNHTGLILNWIPNRKTLAEALQTPASSRLGRPYVDVGIEWRQRLEAIAAGRGRVVDWIDLARRTLARLYHPQPLHPEAFFRALNYALAYTLAFWLLPWLAGGSGKLGQAELLPRELNGFQRLWVLSPILVMGLYAWSKRVFFWSGWKNVFAMIVAVFGAGIAAGAAAASVPGVFAGAFIGAGSFAGAGAVVFAGAFSIALSIVLSVASDVVSVVAFVVALAVGFVAIFAVESRMDLAAASLQNTGSWRARLRLGLSAASPLFLYLLLATSLPLWLDRLLPMHAGCTAANKPSFALLFFLGCLPLLNALFDFLSVGLTQYFLGRMQRGQWHVGWWLADAASALLLVFGLYWLVVASLYAMQAMGWGVDARAVLEQFLADPLSVVWLLLLAMTNVLPTLLHWTLGLAGMWSDRLGGRAQFALLRAQQVLDGEALGRVDAEQLAGYLVVGYRWFSLLLTACLLAWTVCAFRFLLPSSLRWLL